MMDILTYDKEKLAERLRDLVFQQIEKQAADTQDLKKYAIHAYYGDQYMEFTNIFCTTQDHARSCLNRGIKAARDMLRIMDIEHNNIIELELYDEGGNSVTSRFL